MKFKRRIITTISIVFGCILTGAGIVFVSVFMVYPDTDFSRLPVAGGATGKNFEIRLVDRIPFLWSYDLPYPTDFEHTSHPAQSLNGTW